MNKQFASCLVLAVSAACCGLGAAERRLSLEDYRDRMAAAWIGQSVGVSYGAPTEFRHSGELVPEAEMPVWKPDAINGTFNQDDLYVEMTFLRTLETRGVGVSCRDASLDFANSRYRLWCANSNARNNLRRGIAGPASSHPENHRTTDDIDYQIESDFSGIISPGMPARVITLGGQFGRIMNCGDGLFAGVFVGALYAEAYFSTNRLQIVENALKTIPADSRYAGMVRDMLSWYREAPRDWQRAWTNAVDKYQSSNLVGRVSYRAIDVKLNGAMVLLGYLFGEGDMDRTMYISTRGGYDSDCNPSTACGVLATSLGLKRLDSRFHEGLDRSRKWEFTDYDYGSLLAVSEKLARELAVAEGGRIERDAAGAEWFVIPERPFAPASGDVGDPSLRFTDAERASIGYLPCAEGEQSPPVVR